MIQPWRRQDLAWAGGALVGVGGSGMDVQPGPFAPAPGALRMMPVMPGPGGTAEQSPLPSRRDDHGFSPLHWACREGRSNVVDMLIMRGARINVMNRGDDTPLHLAASHGHRDIVQKVPAPHQHLPFPTPV